MIPLAESAVESTRYGRIGVIGTRTTIESKVYEEELRKLKTDLKIYGQACPLLVPLVEEGWVGKPEANMILKKYLFRLKRKNIDTLILGCTHYGFLEKDIIRIMGQNCRVLNGPEIISHKLMDYLERHPEIESRIPKNNAVAYCTTDDPEKFRIFGQRFLNCNIPRVEKIMLDHIESGKRESEGLIFVPCHDTWVLKKMFKTLRERLNDCQQPGPDRFQFQHKKPLPRRIRYGSQSRIHQMP